MRKRSGGCRAEILGTRFSGGPFPIYVSRAEGSKIVDVDGNERVDFINNMTTLILGHRHPAVIDALREQLEHGVSYPAPTPLVVEWGELMCERVPSLDKVRFVNSGNRGDVERDPCGSRVFGQDNAGEMRGCISR